MKLLIVAAIKEYNETVGTILKEASIPVFSITDMTGIKNGVDTSLLDDWFSRGVGKFDSIFVFCFTTESNTEIAMSLISKFNEKEGESFPIRAFVLPVEKFL